MKSALRNPAAEGHLAALETGAARIALARFLSLIALARRLAELRADPASHAHLAVPRSARRLQIGKVHSHVVLNVRFPRNASILHLLFHDHQMPDLEYHPASGGRVGPLDDLVHPAESQTANRLPHALRAGDETSHPLDFQRSRCFFGHSS